MRLLITGSAGQLGRELCLRAPARGFVPLGYDRRALDVTDRRSVSRAVGESGADLAINTAAYNQVDRAEDEPEAVMTVNRDGPGLLAEPCESRNIPLIHVSTDYVFDGTKPGPYLETDPVSPINVYGQSKAAGEACVRERLDRHLIVRTAWLYSDVRKNFVRTILRLARERDHLSVVNDQAGCPTLAGDLAEALLDLAEQVRSGRNIPWGTYHCAGSGSATRFEFAGEIIRLAHESGLAPLIDLRPVSSDQYPTRARRPAHSILDCEKIRQAFGVSLPPWRESLAGLLARNQALEL